MRWRPFDKKEKHQETRQLVAVQRKLTVFQRPIFYEADQWGSLAGASTFGVACRLKSNVLRTQPSITDRIPKSCG